MSTLPIIDVQALKSSARPLDVDLVETPHADSLAHEGIDPTFRAACHSDVDAIYRLISENLSEGRLLPRNRDEIARHVSRFVVALDHGRVVGCADLAPLSRRVAEVRSLVVDAGVRSCGIGRQLVRELERRALASSFEMLTAFTHTPGYFVQLGFSIVPHVWVPEKIEVDCHTCPQFRACGQYAVMLPLIRTERKHVPAHSAHA
jgi:N-acetylglutamate synthase-like GNAT family acetyltransferase